MTFEEFNHPYQAFFILNESDEVRTLQSIMNDHTVYESLALAKENFSLSKRHIGIMSVNVHKMMYCKEAVDSIKDSIKNMHPIMDAGKQI